MKVSDLQFEYPEELVAKEPKNPSRILLAAMQIGEAHEPKEIDKQKLFALFQEGDVLVINETKVEKRRVLARSSQSNQEFEVLFCEEQSPYDWLTLFPLSRLKRDEHLILPDGTELKVTERTLPIQSHLSKPIDSQYFAKHGEMPLPPYIQKARADRRNQKEDETWYQTAWAKNEGSSAAPTASLHFTHQDLEALHAKGVQVERITLHVGMGTFLPIKGDTLKDHKMHEEYADVSNETWQKIQIAKQRQKKVWALGTTVLRALESIPIGKLKHKHDGGFIGKTDIFIYPPYKFQVVEALLTNFHQPESTLLALVAAFAKDLDVVRKNYDYAIQQKFRLFSYGDLSVWIR